MMRQFRNCSYWTKGESIDLEKEYAESIDLEKEYLSMPQVRREQES